MIRWQRLLYPIHLFSFILVIFFFTGYADAETPFNQMVVFGDSFSDSGQFPDPEFGFATGARFTTIDPVTGARGLAFPEHLARQLGLGALTPSTPLILAPRTDLVNTSNINFAVGGNRAPAILDSITGNSVVSAAGLTETQPGFLARLNSGAVQVNPRTLYMVFAGGNDMRDVSDPVATADTVSQALQALLNAGAKTIVVPNLPKLGLVPEADNLTPTGRSALADQRTAAAVAFNQQLQQRLNALSGNIVHIDFETLFDEVLADPTGFGYSPAVDQTRDCYSASEFSGLVCTEAPGLGKASGGNPDDFAFSDGLHPTQATAKIMANYITSILQAPGEVALLPEASLSAARTYHNSVEDYLQQRRWAKPEEGLHGFFTLQGSDLDIDETSNTPGADGNAIGATVGAGLYLDQWLVGASIGASRHNLDIDASRSDYDGYSIFLSLFTSYAKGDWFGEGVATYGRTYFSDLDRTFSLGAANVRTEHGHTDADIWGASLGGGWNALGEESSWQMGPIAGLDYTNITVQGYREKGKSSTALQFADLDRESLIGSLGGFASTETKHDFGSLQWNAELSYDREFEDDTQDVRAVLNTLVSGPSFRLPGYRIDRDAIRAKVGVTATLESGLQLGLSYSYVDSDITSQYLNLSASIRF